MKPIQRHEQVNKSVWESNQGEWSDWLRLVYGEALGLDPSLRLYLWYEIVGGIPQDLEHILAYYIIHHLSATWLAETLAAASSKQTK